MPIGAFFPMGTYMPQTIDKLYGIIVQLLQAFTHFTSHRSILLSNKTVE